MEQLIRNTSSQLNSTDFFCSRPGLDEASQWSVRGFYENKFNDPLNFNLSENSVSLITAIATSFSLVLFNDIVFRALVRAKINEVNKHVILRRHVLETFSNPLTLFLLILRRRKEEVYFCCEEEEQQRTGSSSRKAKITYAALCAMGLLTVFAEFVFIFLATNQNGVYDVQLDGVPIFEFDDRGCEFVGPPTWNACIQVPLTEKPGFNPRGALQICSSVVFRGDNATEGQHDVHLILALNEYMVMATVNYREWTTSMNFRMGYMNESGAMYVGMQSTSAEQIKAALLHRLERTNVTVLSAFPEENVARFGEDMESTKWGLRRPERTERQASQAQALVAGVLGDVRLVDLNETTIGSVLFQDSSSEEERVHLMHQYLQALIRSIMFPTGKGRGVFFSEDSTLYLDEHTSPLVSYNRPWIGVAPSVAICSGLLLIWIALVAMGMESDMDSRWAWKEFMESKTVDDFQQRSDRLLEA